MAKHPVRAVNVRDDEPGEAGEARVLVDRVWPRGVSKERARLDEWLKDVAPSTELRTWYGHDPERFGEFRKRYRAELNATPEAKRAWQWLRDLAARRPVALLTGTRNVRHSQAAVLADRLTRMR